MACGKESCDYTNLVKLDDVAKMSDEEMYSRLLKSGDYNFKAQVRIYLAENISFLNEMLNRMVARFPDTSPLANLLGQQLFSLLQKVSRTTNGNLHSVIKGFSETYKSIAIRYYEAMKRNGEAEKDLPELPYMGRGKPSNVCSCKDTTDQEYIAVHKIILKKKFFTLKDIDYYAHAGKPRETKTRITLTHLPNRYFEEKSYFTKNSKKEILIYGILKPQYRHLQGGSIFSSAKELFSKVTGKVKDFFSPRLDSFNNISSRNLKTYGDQKVQDILIYRTPIPGLLNTALNAVSFGKWNEARQKYGFDKLYHLALVFRLSSGKNIIVEKNEAVNISDSYRTKSDTEVFPITGYASDSKTLYDFINGAREKTKDDKRFFGYDAFTNNCQYFIRYILETAGLYSEGAKSFLFQDLSKVAEELPGYAKTIAKGVTDLGATFNKITGKGQVDCVSLAASQSATPTHSKKTTKNPVRSLGGRKRNGVVSQIKSILL